MERIGRVFCRQLGFSYMESIEPVQIEPNRNQLVWLASCLGYEALITHCLFKKTEEDHYRCKNFVGLKCKNCHSVFNLKETESVEVISPGFPNSYSDNSWCDWLINSESSSRFIIKVLHICLPEKDKYGNCKNGFLELKGKYNDSMYTVSQTLCASSKTEVIFVKGSSLHIRWYSGIFHPRPHDGEPGFHLKVQLQNDSSVSKKLLSGGETSLGTSAIVGLSLGILAVLVAVMVLLKCVLVKTRRVRQKRSLARVLSRREQPSTELKDRGPLDSPYVVLRLGGNEPLPGNVAKQSLNSNPDGIYEEISSVQYNLQTSYLFLDESVRRSTLSPKNVKDTTDTESKVKTDESAFTFQIPTVEVTSSLNDLQFASNAEKALSSWFNLKSQSEPSDMPSPSSTNSNGDSVFGSGHTLQNRTFTINNDSSEKRSPLSPVSQVLLENRQKEYLMAPAFTHRHASVPNIHELGSSRAASGCSRMKSAKFNTSHISCGTSDTPKSL